MKWLKISYIEIKTLETYGKKRSIREYVQRIFEENLPTKVKVDVQIVLGDIEVVPARPIGMTTILKIMKELGKNNQISSFSWKYLNEIGGVFEINIS